MLLLLLPIVTLEVFVPVLILIALLVVVLILTSPPAVVKPPVFIIPALEVTAPFKSDLAVTVKIPPIVPLPLILKLDELCCVVWF